MNLLQAAGLFSAMAVGHSIAKHHALEKACEVVEKEAKEVIGTYQYNWPQLAESTQEKRVKEGFSANDPLLRTGEMRDSIEHNVHGDTGYVGSNNDKAVFQELGTSRGIPPRSFLMGAAMHKKEEVGKTLGFEIVKAIVTVR